MRKVLYLVLFSFAFIQSACRREATVDAPKVDPVPVLFSFLSPDASDTRVTLTMSKPVIGLASNDGYPPISIANVTISDQNGKSQTIPYDANKEYYVVDQSVYPILPGYTYTVSAAWNKYKVSGVTTIPVEVPVLDSLKSEEAGETSWGQMQYQISFKWKDIPGKTNYYRAVLEEVFFQTFGDTISSGYGDKVYSDKNKDGTEFSDRMDYYFNDFGSPTTDLSIYLLHTDIHYYEFHRRRINYFGEDPFSEPSPQYNNVSNGLGVVASYRKSTRKVKI
jgi:hypothetical protein